MTALPFVALSAAVLASAVSAEAPKQVIAPAVFSASTQATEAGGKYGIDRAFDGAPGTHWASAGKALPQSIRIQWAEPVTFDTVSVTIFAAEQSSLYARWKRCEVELDNGARIEHVFSAPNDAAVLRFEQTQTCEAAVLHILDVFAPKTYVGLSEIGFYTDPDRLIRPPRGLDTPISIEEIAPSRRPVHPCVYVTPKGVSRARRNAEQTEWGKTEKEDVLRSAAPWLEHDDAYWLGFLPEPGACYAYGFTGCPVCGASCGTWGGARCSWDRPGTVSCANGHVLPDEDHPDDGTGFQAEDGRVHYIIGTWNAWVTEKWTRNAIFPLAHAYALSGDERYAERAAFFLDALASIYPESTAGSWDYPSSPPSGRFARPWYQVARNLVVFVEAYDLLYSSAVLDKPSLRPAIEAGFGNGPRPQQRAVGRGDAQGLSRPGMTRRENIDRNLMIDGAHYCYTMTFKGGLHNGCADYMRGALAVGALLGIEPYVENAITSPYSIYAMVANNADRDGRYYETALGYALHARSLYLTFVEPLLHWRSASRPKGVNLFDDARMRSFYLLPDLSMDCAGHSPNFGDAGPDNVFRIQAEKPFSRLDLHYAEWLYAYGNEATRATASRLLTFFSDGDVPHMRLSAGKRLWLLYRAEPVPSPADPGLPEDLSQRISGSWVMGQKGMAILRDGQGADAQAALLRYGPSLNHGDKDDLGLIYYGKGWQLTYEIGYGLGSTHCQVGWGSQTVSHCLVTVDERSQAGGSGGSLCLFASLPSIKLVEAESPLSYASLNVSQYRRTVALIGSGESQVLVDLFRVRGGKQHDWTIGVQTQDVAAHGVELGPEEDGSLAPGVAWGEIVGLDGDVRGHPNKPYWNPTPGNGYGFFYDMRRGPMNGSVQADFSLGGPNGAHFRVHALAEPDTEAILARAPGLYPHNSKSTTLMLRRASGQSDAVLESAFATVMEPYARDGVPPNGIPGSKLMGMIVDASARTKHIANYDIVFLGGEKPGDHVTFGIPVDVAGTYRVAVGILHSPSYGTLRLFLDGKSLGQTVDANAASISGPHSVTFGAVELTPGVHRLRFETGEGTRHCLGIASIRLAAPGESEEEPPPGEATPVLESAERIAIEGDSSHMTPIGVRLHRQGRTEYLLSGSPEGDSRLAVRVPEGVITWRGAIVFAAFRGGELQTVATHGAWDVRVAGKPVGPGIGRHGGIVTALDYEHNWVDIDAPIPAGAVGSVVCFRNPRYSRDTAYRIYGVQPQQNGRTRIELGEQPMLLGRGRVYQVLPDNVILSDVPHDYGRGVVGGADTRFFDGKTVTNGKEARTTIARFRYAQPVHLTVADADGFTEDDTLFYYDVSLGDRALIPTAWESAKAP